MAFILENDKFFARYLMIESLKKTGLMPVYDYLCISLVK